MKTPKEMLIIWKSKEYAERVKELEKQDMNHSDAQAVADAEFMQR